MRSCASAVISNLAARRSVYPSVYSFRGVAQLLRLSTGLEPPHPPDTHTPGIAVRPEDRLKEPGPWRRLAYPSWAPERCIGWGNRCRCAPESPVTMAPAPVADVEIARTPRTTRELRQAHPLDSCVCRYPSVTCAQSAGDSAESTNGADVAGGTAERCTPSIRSTSLLIIGIGCSKWRPRPVLPGASPPCSAAA